MASTTRGGMQGAPYTTSRGMAVPVYPWWSVIMVAINILVLYGLAGHWRKAEPEA